MSSVALQLLRRLAVAVLVLSAVLFVGTRLLRELGVLGPGAEEMVEQASASLEAARQYGATSGMPAYAQGQDELQAARTALSRGDLHAARTAARAATADAIHAQKDALVRREELRRQATTVADQLSSEMDRLETLYDDVTPSLPKADVMRLLSHMKKAREVGAGVVLANEQGDYEKVARDEPQARAALAAMRTELEAARK